MASLDGTIAFVQVNQIAVIVAQQLHFQVPRLRTSFSTNTSSLPNAELASR